jgi:hypothetical protein
VIIAVLTPLSFFTNFEYDTDNIKNMGRYNIGSTVFEGDDVIDDNNIMKYPVATNIDFLQDKIKIFDVLGLFSSIITGTIPVPVSKISEYGISDSGKATGFEGPGMLVFKNQKISVEPPDVFIWGYVEPYTFVVKKENSLDIVEDNVTIKTISRDNINNNTINHDYISVEAISAWFNQSDIDDTLAIRYAISNFSDNRNIVKPDEIKKFFGEDVYNYTTKYSAYSPVMVYMHNYNETVFTDAYSNLGSYPEYGDSVRAYNAQQFVSAWNGTIIPPKSSATGMNIVGFATAHDPKAPGGSAAHGVCPPARSLRAAVLSAGFPLPVGMNDAFEAVNFGVNPGSGIVITNTQDFPVQIIMWTEGSGAGMVIHTKIIKFTPSLLS